MIFMGIIQNSSLILLFTIVCLSNQIKYGSTFVTASKISVKPVEDTTNLPQTEGSGEIHTEYGESKTENSNQTTDGDSSTGTDTFNVVTATVDGDISTTKDGTISTDASYNVTVDTYQPSADTTGNGYSEFTQDSFTVSTEASTVTVSAVPSTDGTFSEKPTDVKFLNQSKTSLSFTWLWSYHNIKADNFVIRVYSDDLIVTEFTLNTTTDSSVQQYFYTVQDLSAGTCYNISITAVISSTTGSAQYSDQYGCTLPETPINISATTLANTSIEVIWKWEENAGNIDSFAVMLTSTNGTTYINDVNFTSVGVTNYTVDGLHYGTCYIVSVKAVFRGLSGAANQMSGLTCTLPASPIQVFISEDTITTDGFNVQWTWNNEIQGAVHNFVIIIHDSDHEQVVMETVGNTTEYYTVTRLVSGNCYDVSVAAVFNGRNGSFQHVSTCTVPAVAVNITVLSQNTSSLMISWAQSGGADNFTLTFVDTTTQSEVNYTTSLTQYSVGQLPPGRCFNVAVVTVFRGRYGNPGHLDKACTVPLSPVSLSVTDVTSTDLTVTWRWTADRGDVDKFLVTASPLISSDSIPVTASVTADSDQQNYSSVLTRLTPGQCYNLSVYAVLNEQKGEVTELVSCQYTKPAIPELSFFTYSERTLTISLRAVDGFVDRYLINISCNTQNPSDTTVSGNTTILVSDVLPGSVCTMYITAVRAEMYSKTAQILIKTNETVPGPVNSLSSVNIMKTTIEISWGYPEQPNGNITQYHVQISSAVTDDVIYKDTVPSSNYTYLFTDLSPGSGYKIEVGAENGAGVGAPSSIKVFTLEIVPGPVDGLFLVEITSDNFTVQWNLPLELNGNISHFVTNVNYDGGSRGSETYYDDDRVTYNSTYNGTKPGTCYEITVVAFNNAGGGHSARLSLYTNETAPGTVVNTFISNTTSRSTVITWERPVEPNGLIVKYTVLISRGSDCEQVIELMCVDCRLTCTVDQVTMKIYGQSLGQDMDRHFDVALVCSSGYFKVTVHILALEQSMNLHGNLYNNIGLITNIEQMNPCSNRRVISTNILNFTQDNSSVFNIQVRDLVPASDYNVSIYGHTSVGIGPEDHLEFTTQEDKPSTAVRNVTVINSSSSVITLLFLPPDTPNGQILNYTIEYFYRQHLCQSDIDTAKIISSLFHVLNFNNTFDPIEVDIGSLFSFWEYSFSVVPSTKVGQGIIWSENVTYMTDQSYPGEVDVSSVIFTNITPYKVNISWSKPCYPNGIIINYVIRIMRVSDGTQKVIRTLDNMTTYVQNGLLPDSLYQFEVAAETVIGPGNFTKYKQVRTYTDVPYKPRRIYANVTGPTSVNVSWITPSLKTGPTNYTVMLIDSVNSSIVKRCYTQGFTNTSCSVNNLEEYWGYNVEVIAHTVNGSNSTALAYIVWTLQAAPGPVREFKIILPSDVTKPRSVNVTWKPPAERDKNGMITKYCLSYHTHNEQVTEISVSPGTTFYNNIQLRPQSNYTFEVFAVTVDNGTRDTVQIYVPPGAPQRPPEGNETLIKLDNSASVRDKTKQIAIQLPVTFLCDKNNGVPVRWGVVVVSELKLIKDEPFWGSSLLFDRERRMSYKSWNQVKNYQLYDAYIAKEFNVQPECPQSYNLLNRLVGGRRKRSMKPSTFTVGGDGNCNGNSDKYCNGYLRPGQKYQVKLYVCTEGGCTETKYSDPIVTVTEVPEESSVLMVIIGILAAIVMFTVTIIVAYLTWRKKILCFKQGKADEAGKENPGYSPDIEMTDIPYRLVKLANFPEYVEDLQKDSNLRFSEQYKAIRRLSPSHTTNAAEGQSARIKNRYTNILPFDHSRVKLLPLDDEEGSDYINANYMPGYHSKREYIAAQGPLQCTKDDFWRMTWEQNVSVIVMLTQCVERGRRKCESYWPETPHEPVYFGDIIVETDSESTLPDYVIRIMTMKLGQKKRKIKQIHFLKWPDFGCPETTWLLLDFVMAVRLYKPHDMQGPIIVHCSAGVGRTGTFIALDHLLYRIKEHDEIDIFNIVLEMRNYRPSMVQTEDQYVFIHDCISDYLCASDEDEDLQREQVEEYLAEALYENVPQR